MIYLYKRNKTGICIDRVYGYDTIVELPDMLEGFPVTELGAYIFSDHIDSTELKMMQEKENFCTENGRATRPEDDMPQAAGNRVEEIRLPRQLRKIGRYAFYNCFHLKKLTFYGKMQDLGAGALHHLKTETILYGNMRHRMAVRPACLSFIQICMQMQHLRS